MNLRPVIALADDDEDHAALLAVWLERRGHDALRFPSGDALLAWARTEGGPVDAFLLDVEMPGSSGPAVCRALRGIPRYAATPAAFVSAADEDLVAALARDLGGPTIIPKGGPMLARVAAWLEESLGTPA
jgi:DNA-binding response OmpR family regulator